jgi:trehalose/maltose hydrolase-like predicted phosphorylase
MLPGARRRAAELGLPGAWFGWMCDEDGNELAPEHYQVEIHVNAWVALAAWESARDGDDRAWKEQVYPLLAEVADATCQRADRDDAGGWHLRRVVPPDESVTENPENPGHCDDAVSTNVAFRTSLLAAAALAKQLGREVPERWTEVANGLVVLGPAKDGIIPEYAGYNGHTIKQADTILAFWPLGTDYLDERATPAYPDDVVLRNLDYYQDRVGNRGPLMSPQIDACIRLRHGFGSREEILRDCWVRYRRHVHGPFEVTYECIGNSNSVFLTGCGGLLQTLIYGWFGVHRAKDLAKVPRLVT